jgi:outer membrane receptor protein involved in Fe transport
MHCRHWIRIIGPLLLFALAGTIGVLLLLNAAFQKGSRSEFQSLAEINADYIRDSIEAKIQAGAGQPVDAASFLHEAQMIQPEFRAGHLSQFAGVQSQFQRVAAPDSRHEVVTVPINSGAELTLIRERPGWRQVLLQPVSLGALAAFWALWFALTWAVIWPSLDAQRFGLLGSIAASLAHEIRNPIAATVLPAVTQADDFTDTQVGAFIENKIQWAEKFRSVVAIRGDMDCFDVTSLNNPANSGTSTSFLPSPKLSLIFGPWAKTEVYVQGGFSFHSNDGRGTTQTIEPVSADNPTPGTPSSKIPGLIQTKGAEIGLRTLAVPHLQSTISLWYLRSDSELQQSGDTGGTVASKQPSDRYGVEWANYFRPVEHLSFDLDIADSIARFSSVDGDDAAPGSLGGTHVPEAVGLVISSGITLHDLGGFSASLRLRYFGPRDLTSDDIFRSSDTLLLNAEASYQISKTWRISAEVLNLLDRRDHDIDYAYTSRVTPSAAPVFQEVFHPVEPIQFRFGLTARF